MGSFALTSILLGVGLGILAVSCLTSTVCFGRFANNFDPLEKLAMKVKFNYEKSVYDCSVTIAVLGCLSTVAALGAIVLSILMGDQTIILIAVGGAAAVFGFGCIVAEGVFTDRVVKYNAIEDGLTEHNHEKAQDYMKKAIQAFYELGYKKIKSQNPDSTSDLEDWKTVSSRLGNEISDSNDNIFTYSNIWRDVNLYNSKIYTNYLNLYVNGGFIYAKSKYDNEYDDGTIVATTYFGKEKVSYKEYRNVCWYTKDMTDYKCKKMTYKEYKNVPFPVSLQYTDIPELDEYIVVGPYVNDDSEAPYEVRKFPVMYKLISDDNEIENTNFDYKDDDHFKISSKQFVNAAFKYYKSNQYDEDDRYMAKDSKVKDYNNYLSICDFESEDSDLKILSINRNLKNISELREARKLKAESKLKAQRKLKVKSEEDDGMKEYCQCSSYYGSSSPYPIDNDLLFGCLGYFDKFDGQNRGEIYKKERNYYIKETKKDVQASWSSLDYSNSLYPLALSQMIIQIIAIVLWAVGKFVGPILDGGIGDDKASEAEA